MRTRRGVTVVTLKVAIEAADRAAARGVPGEALRLLLDASTGMIAPDHDHPCPQCGEVWSHLDESCRDIGARILREHVATQPESVGVTGSSPRTRRLHSECQPRGL